MINFNMLKKHEKVIFMREKLHIKRRTTYNAKT